MTQQVNLFTDAFRPPKVVLPLPQILLASLASVVILIAITLLLQADLKSEKQTLDTMVLKNQHMKDRLEILNGKAKKQKKDDSLVAANKRLSEKLNARKKMIGALDTVVVKDDDGFSAILLSLARQKQNNMWLNSIYLGASGKDMRLEGSALNADLVPSYLQKLRQESSFLGRTFTLFELETDPENAKRFNFSLRSEETVANTGMLLSQFDQEADKVLTAAEQLPANSSEKGLGQ